jgi:pimeloyl-ACP methyl ester carboxylesterase
VAGRHPRGEEEIVSTTSINGVEIYYESTGQGDPLVFSHEFGGNVRSWDAQVRHFARWYRCIVYAHRGFPPSSVPTDPGAYSQDILIEDLRALLGHLDIASAHLVGLSLGGNVVLNLALRHPELCRSIVLAGTGSGSVDPAQFAADMAANAALLDSAGMSVFVERYAIGPARVQLRRKDPIGFAEFESAFRGHAARGSSLTIRGVMVERPTIYALKEQLNRLRVPALIVVGDEDEPCLDLAIFMKRQIPSSGLVVMPQTGHTLNLEEPALFDQTVLDFLRAVEHGRWASRE